MFWLITVLAVVVFLARRQRRAANEMRRRLEILEQQVGVLLAERAAPPPAAAVAPPQDAATAPREEAATVPLAGAAQTPAPRAQVPHAGDGGSPSGPEPAAPAAHTDWEWWLGVRGAAVLGGGVLALAGLFFFRYAVQQGLIAPWVRVVAGTLVATATLCFSEIRLRRGYEATANAVSGGSVVVLYAAFWAAGIRYGLVPAGVAFALMTLVTAACCALSWRHSSPVVASIGLIGGFATPLMVSSGGDRPLGLFAYVLLLDAGLLAVARRRGWPLLALLSLAGTVLYQAVWIGRHMGADRLWLGLGILTVFSLVFVVAGVPAPREGRRAGAWVLTQAAAILLPFLFAAGFAVSARLGTHLYPTGVMLLLLMAAAGWLARMEGQEWLRLAAAGAAVGVVAIWVLGRHLNTPLAWEGVGVSVAVALAAHVFVEWSPEDRGWQGPAPAAVVSSAGLLGFLLVAGLVRSGDVAPWPWLFGWGVLGSLLVRHGGFEGRGPLMVVAGGALGLGLAGRLVLADGHGGMEGAILLAITGAVGLALQTVAVAREGTAAHAWSERGAASFPITVLCALAWIGSPPLPLSGMLGAAGALGFLGVLAATRLGDGRWALASVAATALAHWAWTARGAPPGIIAPAALAIEASCVLVFTGWPFLVRDRVRGDLPAWWASALAGPLWFLSLKALFVAAFGDGAIGLVPVGLGGVTLAAAWRVRTMWSADEPARRSALAWYLGVTAAFLTVAIPLQLEREWVMIGWALEGAALLWLWRRLDHAGLKYLALALLLFVAARLVAVWPVLHFHPQRGFPVVNWIMYTYLTPAACLFGAAAMLAPLERRRLRPWEEAWYPRSGPLAAAATGLAGIVVVFVWINLAVADWFGAAPGLRLFQERLPQRDVAMSIAWGVYALVLLAAGVRLSNRGLRWCSLVLLMATIAKVFLHDLGELHDLYRVASLGGLAVSLIVVSFAYQRFVLTGRRGGKEP